jgi:hypothetical protein
LPRFGDGRKVPAAGRGQAAGVLVDEVFSRLQGADVHRVLVDVLDGFAHALGRFQIAAIFGSVQAAHDFGGQDGFDRLVTHPGEDVDLQMADDLFRVALRPFPVFLGAGVPGAGQAWRP